MSDNVRRIRTCVENWPEAQSGEYNPRCCRFPKSCSCTSYNPDTTKDEDLEPMTTQPAGEHHTGTLDLTGEGNAPEFTIEALHDEICRTYGVIWSPDNLAEILARHGWVQTGASRRMTLDAMRLIADTRKLVAEEIAAKANEIAEAYQKSAEYYRAISLEVGSGEPKGQRYMRTALSFKNNAAGAWAAMHAARDIGGGA